MEGDVKRVVTEGDKKEIEKNKSNRNEKQFFHYERLSVSPV